MTTEEARRIERPPIEIDRQYTFYSTMQQEYEPEEKRLRNYTGRLVTVLAENPSEPEEERIFAVRAKDGFEFDAYEGELNNFMCDTGQFFWPDATWGHEHDPFALVNEKA